MLNKAWGHLYCYFTALDKTTKDFQTDEFTVLLTPIMYPVDNKKALYVLEDTNQENLLKDISDYFSAIQRKLQNDLTLCRKKLSQIVQEKELNYVMSALVFYCDELVLTKCLTEVFSKLECHYYTNFHSPAFVVKTQWPSLQQSQLHCREGGEIFFKNINELLIGSSNLALAAEVYYFCLKRGFLGRYVNSPHEINRNLTELAQIIMQNKSVYAAPLSAESMNLP